MIQLAKRWRIDNSNPPEVVLQKFRTTISNKNATVTHNWDNVAYCCTYSGVFSAYLMYHSAGASTIKELLQRIAEVKELFKDALTTPKTTQEIENARGKLLAPNTTTGPIGCIIERRSGLGKG